MTVETETVSLSKREREVVVQIAQGKKYQEIADSLKINYETVKTYAARTRKKLNLSSKVDLALWAFRSGLVD